MVDKKIEVQTWGKNSVLIWANTGELGSKFVEVSFVDNETVFNLTNRNVILYAEKPDKMIIFNDCQIIGDPQDGKALFEITEQITAVQGIVNCEFHIIEGNSIILKIPGIKIIVNECTFNELEIQSSSEYSTLLSAIQNANSALESAQNLVNSIDSKIDSKISDTEIGTWTPQFVLGGAGNTLPTYITNSCYSQYYRVGKVCYINFYWRVNITDPGNIQLYIGNLPFRISSNNGWQTISGDAYDTYYSQAGGWFLYSGETFGCIRKMNTNDYEKLKVTNSLKLAYSGFYIIDSVYY